LALRLSNQTIAAAGDLAAAVPRAEAAAEAAQQRLADQADRHTAELESLRTQYAADTDDGETTPATKKASTPRSKR
jgi:hypothetical protein